MISIPFFSNASAGARIPGPSGYPLLGNALELSSHASRGKTHEYFEKLSEEYGQSFLLSMAGNLLVVSSDKDLIHRALTDTTNFHRNELFDMVVKGIAEFALFTLPSGEVWKRHRKYLQPAFGPVHLRHAGEATTSEMAILMDYWSSKCDVGSSTTVDIFQEFTALTLDVIGQIAFSHHFKASESYHNGVDSEGHDIMQDIAALVQERFNTVPITWKFSGLGSNSPRVTAIRKYVDQLFEEILAAKKLQTANGETKLAKDKDVLDRLLDTDEDDNDKFSKAEIVGEVLGFFLAGHETSANTMTFMAYELSRNPEIQAKLKEEIKQALHKNAGVVTVEHLNEFPYLDRVMKETQRLHSIIPIIGRAALHDIEHNGFLIPAKTVVLCNIRGMHLNESYWTDPTAFNPDRWNEPIEANAFAPFGSGPMNCIGQKMAVIELKLAMIHLLSRFTLRYVEQELDFITSTTYGLKRGLSMELCMDT
ncbi:cytochrome P450 [Chytriomyces cf. hyalinus JEL632]|nr:cytochrome P450 [Chytriomyces cf. hyalinus JEL632]